MNRTNEQWTRDSLKGGIHQLNSDGTFTGYTETQSKTFKTYKGAVKFLENKGYSK